MLEKLLGRKTKRINIEPYVEGYVAHKEAYGLDSTEMGEYRMDVLDIHPMIGPVFEGALKALQNNCDSGSEDELKKMLVDFVELIRDKGLGSMEFKGYYLAVAKAYPKHRRLLDITVCLVCQRGI